jgi:hypothetical protein
MRWAAALALASVGCAVAWAVDRDARGWTSGTPAKRTELVVKGAPEFPKLSFPAPIVDRAAKGPVVLFYFSPTCPHCRHVGAEVAALARRLTRHGATLVGVVHEGTDEAALAEFRREYDVGFEILQDTGGAIGTAMAVRSTPSMMLVGTPKEPGKRARDGAAELEARDLWYPYLPGWDGLVEGRVRGDMFAIFAPGEYQGNNLCGACHLAEHASWRLTHHSVAWRTLEVRGKTTDPKCVDCHVTGAGQAGGWGSDVPTDLVDVGCESCHGPGGPHDGSRVDARTTCAGCHDAEHSIDFTVEKGLPLIDHYAADHRTEAEKEARMDALWEGEAPRDLLAFREGPNVGSARCRECHATEYDHWAQGPHAAGMASLQAEGSDRADCVRCHATGKATTATPSAKVADYDTLGGVGCESCHGPGDRHVAAGGGTDNIQGLGKSCPVCVVEALCTSCHTPKWSPDFELDAFLERARHPKPGVSPSPSR